MKKQLLTTLMGAGIAAAMALPAAALELKNAQVNGENIAYYDSEGEGMPVVFIHGNSSSSLAFEKQLTGDLADKYRVIALDLPGHGETGTVNDTALNYSFAGMADLIEDFLSQNELDHGLVIGWSLGGHLVLEMADDLPNVKGFAIFGTPPVGIPADMGAAFLPNPAVNYGFQAALSGDQMDTYVDSFMSKGRAAPFSFRHDIRKTDGLARQGIAISLGTGQYKDELAVVANLTQPLAIFHGANEQLINGDYFSSVYAPTLWKNSVQSIYNAGHAPQIENSHEFNFLVDQFASDVSQ